METITRQPQQITQYVLNKEDLENSFRTIVTEILGQVETARAESRLSIKQVSKRLGVDPSTLWRWERDGYLIPTRIGRKVLYKESDIIAVEEGRK